MFGVEPILNNDYADDGINDCSFSSLRLESSYEITNNNNNSNNGRLALTFFSQICFNDFS